MTDMLQLRDTVPAAPEAPAVVVFPGEAGWDDARRAWNLAVDQHPAAVALPETARDVCQVVAWASARGLRVAAQGTGHNAAPLGSLDGVVLVKTHRMRAVGIDPVTRVARVQAGALWGDVVRAAGEHGLAALAGSSHDVGVVGYTLGGGLSFLARRYGLASDRVLAMEIVTAEGELVRADRSEHADLFWAVRGGGGSFGVVTAMEFELIELPTVFAGALFFPIERAREVLHAWREWTRTTPDSITSIGRVLRFPPIPDLPPHLSGRSFVLVEAVCTDGETVGAEALAPLRALGPEMDTLATIPTQDLIHLHMDPPGPVPGAGDHQLLDQLSPEALDAALALVGPEAQTHLLSFEFRHLGGAVAHGSADSGALAAIDARYATFGVGIAATPEMAAAVRADLAAIRTALTPHASDREYSNFAESASNPAMFYDEDAYARLRVVKRAVDPGEVFLANHPIRPL